jgi:hypothetical protein
MRVILTALLVAVVGLESATARQSRGNCVFPGTTTVCEAPGKRTRVNWQEASEGRRHRLLLSNADGGGALKLLDFDRSVEIFWAPDGNTLAITDRGGSDFAAIWVASVKRPGNLANVEERFIAALGRPAAIYRNGHRYFEAIRWVDNAALLFQVRAYDSTPGKEYTARFVYHLDGRVAPVTGNPGLQPNHRMHPTAADGREERPRVMRER